MTVRLDLPSDVVNRLTQEAQENGLSLDGYILQKVLDSQDQQSRNQQNQVDRDHAGQMIRELRRGNKLGPDLSVRNIIDEGRRF